MLQQPQLLGHLGQVGRERQPAGRGLVIEPARRAVGGVRAEARPGAGGDLGLRADRREPVPGLVAGLEAAIALQADQLGEDDRRGRAPRPPASQLRPAVVVSASNVVPASMQAVRLRADRIA